MHSFFWYSSLLITDSSKAGSCRPNLDAGRAWHQGMHACSRRDWCLTAKGPCGTPNCLA